LSGTKQQGRKLVFTLKKWNSENPEGCKSMGNFGGGRCPAEVKKFSCSLLVCGHLKLLPSREGDRVLVVERRRCSDLRSYF